MNIGIAYTVLAAFFCNNDSDCSDVEACICTLKSALVLCALISKWYSVMLPAKNLLYELADIIADVGLLAYNWYFFIVLVKEFNVPVARRWLVYMGFSSSILTLIINIVFWTSYMAFREDDYMLIICLSNGVVSSCFLC